ncbi:MAG: hypothetical protein ACYCXN_02405 [Acidimicrobiales bacterium]|jgi:hypothetical protein
MTTDEHDATFYRLTPLPPAAGPDPGAGEATEPLEGSGRMTADSEAGGSAADNEAGGSAAESATSDAAAVGGSAVGDRERGDNPPGTARKRHRSRVTKTAAGLALVLGAGTGAGAVIMTTASGGVTRLASSTARPSALRSTARVPRGGFTWAMDGPGPGGRFHPGAFLAFPGIGAGGVVHGSYTVKGPNGYETLDTQVGTVEAVSSTSVTVKSADGYSQKYSVVSTTVVYADQDGIASIKTGDEVTVVGLVGSSGVTAEHIVDVTQVQANGTIWHPSPPSPPASLGAPRATSGPTGGTTTGALFGHDSSSGNYPGANYPRYDGPGDDGPGSAA